MIKIVADTSASFSEDFLKENDIRVVHFNFLLGNDREFTESHFDNYSEIYKAFEEEKQLGKTSQPSVADYERVFKEILANGDEVLCITISSNLSGTYNTACMVANQVDAEKITVIDSGNIIQCEREVVLDALELIKKGKTRKQIEKTLYENREKHSVEFLPVTLDALKRGGRIGKLGALIGSVLDIKPIIVYRNNTLMCAKKVLGVQKAIVKLVSDIPKSCKKLYLLYVHESPIFRNFVDQVKNKFRTLLENKEISKLPVYLEENVSPTAGIHVGLGAIGWAY